MSDITVRPDTSVYGGIINRRITVTDLAKAKDAGEKWPMLTAYDAIVGGLLDEAGIPVLLVGDSAAMVVQGHTSTLPITMDDLILSPLRSCVERTARWWWPTFHSGPIRKVPPRPWRRPRVS